MQSLLLTWDVPVPQAMPQGGIAYYNCGPESGASQPHKHVQVSLISNVLRCMCTA